jgi:hypothetical protein
MEERKERARVLVDSYTSSFYFPVMTAEEVMGRQGDPQFLLIDW